MKVHLYHHTPPSDGDEYIQDLVEESCLDECDVGIPAIVARCVEEAAADGFGCQGLASRHISAAALLVGAPVTVNHNGAAHCLHFVLLKG
jgi:hypothetical protein